MSLRPACTVIAAIALDLVITMNSTAAELKVLTAGAYKAVLVAVVPEFERKTGHKVAVDNDTVGALVQRVGRGETFDVIIASPKAIDDLARDGKVTPGSKADLAKVGVGVMVKAGAPKPDVSTVEAFKQAVLGAKSIAYLDPASGGSSGIYVAKLLEQLGLAEQVKGKTRLKQGGYVADLIASGEAELGIHQISEILPSKEVTLVGPLPDGIQSYTTYSAGISNAASDRAAAEALVQTLAGPPAAQVLAARGMMRP
jgi:molybdate transport system substrate-binding protein